MAQTIILPTRRFGGAPARRFPHEPAGAIRMRNGAPLVMDFDYFEETGSGNETDAQPFYDIGWGGATTLTWGTTVTDGAAPWNPNTIGRMEFNPTNCTPPYGQSIDNLRSEEKFKPPSTAKLVYVHYWVKYSSNWRTIPNEVKQYEFFANEGQIILSTRDHENPDDTGPCRIHLYLSNGTPQNTSSSSRVFTLNMYHRVECVADFPNDAVKVWLDEVLEIDVSGDIGFTAAQMIETQMPWVYGGSGPSEELDRTMYMYHDEMVVSYTT